MSNPEVPFWVSLINEKIASTERTITDSIGRLTQRLDDVVSVQTDQGKDIVRLETKMADWEARLLEVRASVPNCAACERPSNGLSLTRRQKAAAAGAGVGFGALLVEVGKWIFSALSRS